MILLTMNFLTKPHWSKTMESFLVTSFYQILTVGAELFRPNVVGTYFSLALAWVACPNQQRTSNLLRTLGPQRQAHHATYYRFFSTTNWCLDRFCCVVFAVACQLLGTPTLVRLVVDDSLLKHTGNNIFGASIFRDAVLSSKKVCINRWGINIVILVWAFPNIWKENCFICLPLNARIFLTEQWCQQEGKTYRSPTELTLEMVECLLAKVPDTIEFRLVGDNAYTNGCLLSFEHPRFHYTGTIRSDAVIQKPLSSRKYKGVGTYPKYGLPYPKPREMLKNPGYKRQRVRFSDYQGQSIERKVISFQGTYARCAGQRELRFVFIEPVGKGCGQYLVTTDLSSPLSVILQDLVARWSVEVGIREGKQDLGIEKSQVWTEGAVSRQAPFGLLLISLVKIWYMRNHLGLPDVELEVPWYQKMVEPSFEKMLATLRYCIYRVLLSDVAEHHPIWQYFGLPLDREKRIDWILRNFCNC